MLPGPDGASATQESQTPQGSGVGPFTQFRLRARIRALDVLPQPRGPLNRYAWLIRPLRNAWRSGAVTWSWPRSSANVAGRDFRYRAKPCVVRVTSEPSAMTSSSPARSHVNAGLACCAEGLPALPAVAPERTGPPAHPSEPAYPCCLPALGGLAR